MTLCPSRANVPDRFRSTPGMDGSKVDEPVGQREFERIVRDYCLDDVVVTAALLLLPPRNLLRRLNRETQSELCRVSRPPDITRWERP